MYRDLLFYRLASQFALGGKLHNATKSLYAQPTARVKNERFTETFRITSGVKQGDNMSPTLFTMYLNDLAVEVNYLNCGNDIDGRQVTILLYYCMQMILFFWPKKKARCKNSLVLSRSYVVNGA